MNELPTDLAEALHLVDPSRYRDALIVLAPVLLMMLLFYLSRRRRPAPAPGPAPSPLPPSAALAGIEGVIADIRTRYLQSLDFRRGCHELSQSLKSHFETKSRKPLSTLTAREIAAVVGDTAVASVFELLAELQFRRRRPSGDEFEGICDMAVTVSKVKKP